MADGVNVLSSPGTHVEVLSCKVMLLGGALEVEVMGLQPSGSGLANALRELDSS